MRTRQNNDLGCTPSLTLLQAVIKIITLLAVLLLPLASTVPCAHAQQPNGTLSVQLVAASTDACTNAIPPGPAQAAGYNKLVFCSDFTQPKYAKISDWLGGCGVSEPDQWWLTTWFGDSNGANCDNVEMVNDGSSQVLHMKYTTADWAVHAKPIALYTCKTWTGSDDCSFVFSNSSIYAEITFRLGEPGLQNGQTQCDDSRCEIISFWGAFNAWDKRSPDPTGNVLPEWDWLEIFHFGTQRPYATSAGLQWFNGGGGGPGTSNNSRKVPLDPNYHTLSALVTGDNNGNGSLCSYWDGEAGAGFRSDQTKCGIMSGNSIPAMWDVVAAVYVWGPNNADPNQTDIYIKNIRIWSCGTTSKNKYFTNSRGIPVFGPCPLSKIIDTPP
jgi:hypothetical protein